MKTLYYIFAPAIYMIVVAGVLDYFYDYNLKDMLIVAFFLTMNMIIIFLNKSKHLTACCSSLTFVGVMVALRECTGLFGEYYGVADVMLSLFAVISLVLLVIAVYKKES